MKLITCVVMTISAEIKLSIKVKERKQSLSRSCFFSFCGFCTPVTLPLLLLTTRQSSLPHPYVQGLNFLTSVSKRGFPSLMQQNLVTVL